jgi:maleylacetate reductase
LKELGMTSDDLDKAAQIASQNPYWNPRPISADSATALRNLLQNAWEGASPVAS